MRRVLRVVVLGFITGSLLVGSVWAGIGSLPVGTGVDGGDAAGIAGAGGSETSDALADPELEQNQLMVGASKISLYPRPDADKGEVWVRTREACQSVWLGGANPQNMVAHLQDFKLKWPENPNCLYMGGFGLGPGQPVVDWDTENGLWVRTAAFVKDGKGVVITILDGEGYFAKYNAMCGEPNDCGIFDLQQQLAAETGLDPASFIVAATHAHSAMDFIGGWGGVPTWYMRQVASSIRSSVRQALGLESCPADDAQYGRLCNPLQPATLEAGDALARPWNSERRATYHSAQDPTVNWIRALRADNSVITTVGAYAAHPTSFGGSATTAHADWPGAFEARAERRWPGSVALMFLSGLGNMSKSGNWKVMGEALADLLPDAGAGKPVPSPSISVQQTFWDQPATNVPLTSVGAAGVFDRTFNGTPAQVSIAKRESNKPCRSASAASVRVSASAAKIGGVWITAAPGEIFANFSNTIEEKAPITALAIGQANDALGYMPQSFETDHAARQGGGFVGGDFFEYEDAYSIDACFGDAALEAILTMLGA